MRWSRRPGRRDRVRGKGAAPFQVARTAQAIVPAIEPHDRYRDIIRPTLHTSRHRDVAEAVVSSVRPHTGKDSSGRRRQHCRFDVRRRGVADLEYRRRDDAPAATRLASGRADLPVARGRAQCERHGTPHPLKKLMIAPLKGAPVGSSTSRRTPSSGSWGRSVEVAAPGHDRPRPALGALRRCARHG